MMKAEMLLCLSCLCVLGLIIIVTQKISRRKSTPSGQRADRTVIWAPKNSVVLVTGEIRFEDEDALQAFKARLLHCRVLVVTWPRCANVARKLVENIEDIFLLSKPNRLFFFIKSFHISIIEKAFLLIEFNKSIPSI